MFHSSFIHIDGIGPKLEKALWREGICGWQTALDANLEPIAHSKSDWIKRGCEAALRAVERHDLRHFAERWPSRDAWRWFKQFANRAIYLDIETDGNPKEVGTITTIGTYDGSPPRMLVHGRDLDSLPEMLAPFDLIVTYNGGSFDLPYIKSKFPGITLPPLHLDLCPSLRQVGLKGGLKSIERQTGLNRPEFVDEADGWTAVLLWRKHLAGDDRALPTLLRYCAEDIVALEPLARIAFNRHLDLLQTCPSGVERMEKMARPYLAMPFSHEILQELTGVFTRQTTATAPAAHDHQVTWNTDVRPLVVHSAYDRALEWLKRKTAEPDTPPPNNPPSLQ